MCVLYHAEMWHFRQIKSHEFSADWLTQNWDYIGIKSETFKCLENFVTNLIDLSLKKLQVWWQSAVKAFMVL